MDASCAQKLPVFSHPRRGLDHEDVTPTVDASAKEFRVTPLHEKASSWVLFFLQFPIKGQVHALA